MGGGRLGVLARPSILLGTCWTLCLVVLVWFGITFSAPRGPILIGWVPLPLAALTTCLLCVRASRAPGVPPAARRFWRQFGFAVVCMGLATISQARDALSGPDSPSQRISFLTMGMYAVCVLTVLWALLRLPAGVVMNRAIAVRFCLDAAIVVLTAGTFAWHLSYRRVGDWISSAGSIVPSLMLVLFGCTAVLAFVKLAIAGVGAVDRGALRVLAIAAAAASAAGALSPLLAARLHLNDCHLAVPLACGIVAMAAERQHRVAGIPPPPPRAQRRPFSLVPYVAIAATDGLLLATRGGSLAVAVAAVGLTGIVVGRQIVAFYDNARLLRRVDASLLDVREAQRLLTHQANHDGLTGLANRSHFEERVRAAAARGTPFSVALVDLDDFKAVNDRLGHVVGDRLLVAVAQRLRAGVRPEDLVARLGGDEFVLLLESVPPADAGDVLARLAAALERPIRVDPHDLLIRCSAGFTDGWSDADPTELLRRADVAMYAAKERGKGRGARYEPDLDLRADSDAQLGADLRRALDHGEFYLLYQPIVRLPDGATVGVESLVRWRLSDGRTVPPDRFIAAAERTGLIVPIGRWILAAACRQGVEWLHAYGAGRRWRVSVNISARQLREPDFAAEVATVLVETGLPAERLVIEVTETAVFDNEQAVAALTDIAALGVVIALDDFGTGHSSLGVLRSCPVGVLKVDKSFIEGITRSSGEAVIATAMIQIAEGLNLVAVAEGVETAEQAARLYELGYRLAQGYYFAVPLPPGEAGPLLAAAPAPVAAAAA
jgi:diguanylate cyclase (GGDEF)-like protein